VRVGVMFFFSSRRRHTRFSRDWSSDVCSSDLWGSRRARNGRRIADRGGENAARSVCGDAVVGTDGTAGGSPGCDGGQNYEVGARDRESGVKGKSVESGTRRCRNNENHCVKQST